MRTWLEYANLHLDKPDDFPLECEVKDAKEVLAEIERLTRERDAARAALQQIRDVIGPGHGEPYSARVADRALEQTVGERHLTAEEQRLMHEALRRSTKPADL